MAATKYILCIDYKANVKNGFEWAEIDARSEMDAMAKADEILSSKENVYLAKILKKIGAVHKNEGAVCADYVTILCRRSCGWIINDSIHGEYTWTATKYAIKGSWWVEVNG